MKKRGEIKSPECVLKIQNCTQYLLHNKYSSKTHVRRWSLVYLTTRGRDRFSVKWMFSVRRSVNCVAVLLWYCHSICRKYKSVSNIYTQSVQSVFTTMQERVAEKQRNVQMKHLTKSCKVVVWISDWPPVSASALSRDHSERNNKKKNMDLDLLSLSLRFTLLLSWTPRILGNRGADSLEAAAVTCYYL